jgi:hypothetical protein
VDRRRVVWLATVMLCFPREEVEMNRRLLFSIALIAVLIAFWLALTKPICGDRFTASLESRSGWTCVAK